MQAFSYTRFSTPGQATGDSFRRQTEGSERYARENGLTLNTDLTFQDLGVSAYQGSNQGQDKGLGQFLKACETGLVPSGSWFIVESLDRLSRQPVETALSLFLSILRFGITIVTLSDNQVYKPGNSNWTPLIIALTVMARGHEESKTKSMRLSAAWEEKRRNASSKPLTSVCPNWMKLSDDRTRYELIPERAAVLQEIITLSKNGIGGNRITSMLNERKVPTFSGGSTGWHSSYLQKILTNRALYGEYQPCKWIDNKPFPEGDPIPNYFPAVITKETFLSLQAARASNGAHGKARKGVGISNIFSGLLRCGYCNSTMILSGMNGARIKGEDGTQKRISTKSLLCDGARRGKGCFALKWNYPDFEKSMLEFCKGTNLEEILSDVRRNQGQPLEVRLEDKLAAVEKQIEEIQQGIDNLLDIMMARKSDGPASQSLNSRLDKLEIEKATAVNLMRQMQVDLQQKKEASHETTSAVTRSLIESMESVSDDERFRVRAALAAQLRRFVDSVKMYPAGRLVTPEFIESLKMQLTEQGFTQDQIDGQVETYKTEPKRDGAKGSKYSKTSGRFFTITTKTGGMRVVYPDYEDPSKAKVVMGFGDQRGQVTNETEGLVDKVMEEFRDYFE